MLWREIHSCLTSPLQSPLPSVVVSASHQHVEAPRRPFYLFQTWFRPRRPLMHQIRTKLVWVLEEIIHHHLAPLPHRSSKS
ncbi:hypothetical protein V6N13_070763 [Hibiscus sabdariffa]